RIKTDGRFLKEQNLTAEKMDAVHKLNDMAIARGQTLSQMSLAWILKDKYITSVLVGASNSKQIVDNVGAINNVVFSSDELKYIDTLTKNICVW
ncbi:MAG: aldo/keto reductase, partial [Clostridia bacterium]